MAYLNKILLMGNVGKDPDIRTFEGGEKVGNLTLATTKKYTDRSGQIVSQTTWHTLVVRGKNAEVVEKYVKKGDPLFVEGELISRSYNDDRGLTRIVYEVRVAAIQLLKAKEQAQAAEQTASADDGDLPF